MALEYFDKVVNCNNPVLIVSSTETPIFTGSGVLIAVIVGNPVAGGTYHFTDSDDAAISGLPTATDPWTLDGRGTDYFFELGTLENGLKCVTTTADTISMSVMSYTP